MSNFNIENEIDKIYGIFTIIEYAYIKNSRHYYKCRCECGHITIKRIQTAKNSVKLKAKNCRPL